MRQPQADPELLTPAAVAAVFFVDPKTVTRWAAAGRLPAIRTPGGHRRFRRSDVIALLGREHDTGLDVRHAGNHLAVPALAQAAPGSPAAAAAAVVAEAAAQALEVQARVAAEAVARAAAVLHDASVRSIEATAFAREARGIAAVHAAYSERTAS